MVNRFILILAIATFAAACSTTKTQGPAVGKTEEASAKTKEALRIHALTTALAKANGYSVTTLDLNEASILKTTDAYKISFKHTVGEAGDESCVALYNFQNHLKEITCEFDYISESMGDENHHTTISATRVYSNTGKLTRVDGKDLSKRTRDDKILRKKRITSTHDEQLAELIKPLMILPAPVTADL